MEKQPQLSLDEMLALAGKVQKWKFRNLTDGKAFFSGCDYRYNGSVGEFTVEVNHYQGMFFSDYDLRIIRPSAGKDEWGNDLGFVASSVNDFSGRTPKEDVKRIKQLYGEIRRKQEELEHQERLRIAEISRAKVREVITP